MVSNILPVPYYIRYYKSASYCMDHYPKGLEKQCYPCFSQGKDGHSGTILVGVAHDMSRGPGPDPFNASPHDL